MSDFFEFDLTDIMNDLQSNVKKDSKKDFIDIVNLDSALNRILFLEDIEAGVGLSFDTQIRFWNRYDEAHNIPVEDREPIKVIIDSCGGSLTDAFIIIDAIRKSKTPVWTIAAGCAYSGGFFVLIAGDRRSGYKHSSYLFHEGSASNGGTSSQFENFTAFYKKQLEQLKEIVLSYTNISKEQYDKIKKEDIWYTATEALENGIIDEILE